jgi:hypothetical protein
MLLAFSTRIQALQLYQHCTTDIYFCEALFGKALDLHLGLVQYGHRTLTLRASQSQRVIQLFLFKMHRLLSSRPYRGTLGILYENRSLNLGRSSTAGGYRISRSISQ